MSCKSCIANTMVADDPAMSGAEHQQPQCRPNLHNILQFLQQMGAQSFVQQNIIQLIMASHVTHKIESTSVQVMAWCHSSEVNFTSDTSAINH